MFMLLAVIRLEARNTRKPWNAGNAVQYAELLPILLDFTLYICVCWHTEIKCLCLCAQTLQLNVFDLSFSPAWEILYHLL
jgi:hypothetical protein